MFINKLNQLYKPRRILNYTDADDSVIADFRNGKICDKVSRYADSFGTYDYPGIYYIKSLGKSVIGIEFRDDDENVAYPDVISMFLSGKELRILCDMRVDEDRAINIIKDDYECFEKKDLLALYIDAVGYS